MTNREWLATLNSKQFLSWMFDKSMIVKMDGTRPIYDNLYPRYNEIAKSTISGRDYMELWLDKERNEDGGKLL